MFGRNSTPPIAQHPTTTAGSPSAPSLLQAVSARATAPDSGYGTPSPAPSTNTTLSSGNPTTTTAIHPSTNPASFRSLLGSHRAVVAMFTSATCPPCRMIEPVFEELARAKAKGQQVAFVRVDLGVGMGSAVAREYGVAATPTFGFFLDGTKVRGAGFGFSLFRCILRSVLVRRFMN